jgi:hypothetical protein
LFKKANIAPIFGLEPCAFTKNKGKNSQLFSRQTTANSCKKQSTVAYSGIHRHTATIAANSNFWLPTGAKQIAALQRQQNVNATKNINAAKAKKLKYPNSKTKSAKAKQQKQK